jgi:hypothetical protein
MAGSGQGEGGALTFLRAYALALGKPTTGLSLPVTLPRSASRSPLRPSGHRSRTATTRRSSPRLSDTSSLLESTASPIRIASSACPASPSRRASMATAPTESATPAMSMHTGCPDYRAANARSHTRLGWTSPRRKPTYGRTRLRRRSRPASFRVGWPTTLRAGSAGCKRSRMRWIVDRSTIRLRGG